MSFKALDEDLIQEARVYYQKRNFRMLDPLLQQMMAQNHQSPEVYQMQANLYIYKGQFTKAIRCFKQALEIDPTYADASIGLSVLYNDIGKYEEARQVYEEAEKHLQKQKEISDPSTHEKLASKHEELADLYLQSKKYPEALEQLGLALHWTQRKAEVILRMADIYLKLGQEGRAVKELRQLILQHPDFVGAKVKLGLIYYSQNKVREAIEQWESVLLRDPQNSEVQRYLRRAKLVENSEVNL